MRRSTPLAGVTTSSPRPSGSRVRWRVWVVKPPAGVPGLRRGRAPRFRRCGSSSHGPAVAPPPGGQEADLPEPLGSPTHRRYDRRAPSEPCDQTSGADRHRWLSFRRRSTRRRRPSTPTPHPTGRLGGTSTAAQTVNATAPAIIIRAAAACSSGGTSRTSQRPDRRPRPRVPPQGCPRTASVSATWTTPRRRRARAPAAQCLRQHGDPS